MPALPDLEPYSIRDLEELQTRIAERIPMLRKQAAAELRERFTKEAEQLGFSIDDLFNPKSAIRRGKTVSARTSADARYRNPGNPAQTWNGIGRQPKWVVDFLGLESRTLADLEIKKVVHETSGRAA